MPAHDRIPNAPRPPLLAAVGARPRGAGFAALLLAAGLALIPARTVAADAHAKMPRPALNVQANASRKTLLKERSAVLGLAPHHAGKLVGGHRAPPPKTIVTKRFLPK